MNNQAYDDTATRNPRKAYTDYENSTYTVVSKVAYLIGVQKRIFENEYEPPKMEWYEKLHADKNCPHRAQPLHDSNGFGTQL